MKLYQSNINDTTQKQVSELIHHGNFCFQKHPYQLDLIRCLQTLLQNNKYRQVFDLIDGVSFIINMLSHRNNFQVQYQLIFCLWLLTFKSEIASKEIMPSTVIKLLSDCLNDSAKEKVVRITLALFKNLLTIPEESSIIKQNTIVMLRYRVLKQLMVLRKQKYSDEDIVNDIHFLIDHLTHTLEDLSSFDLYESELKSGELRWSPPHKSTEFWNQNATKFNDNNYEKLRRLTDILKDSNEPKILSIACYDVGQYVQAYSPGKKIIELLGAKTIIMSLLHHPDPSVKYEALLAVQKIMIRNL
ncbi:V-type proton ATPase subunit H [Blattella germanica]|nr:V-type proton ATPase subunit H [Blattella germanica]